MQRGGRYIRGVSELAALSPADLHALRLATQVFRHKAALQGRSAVERYWTDLGRAVDFALAAHGVGFVVGTPPQVMLDRSADHEDRLLLDEHLGLLASNAGLPRAVRELCAALRERVAV
jgi:hypothetical protein